MTTAISAATSPLRSLGRARRFAPALLPLAALALLMLGERACAAEPIGAHLGRKVASLGLQPDAGSVREVSPGVLQFTAQGAVFHLIGDSHLVGGTLFELGAEVPRNLTLERHLEIRQAVLGEIPESDLLLFPAEGERLQRIYVFTDPTCGFCQRFHGHVEALNAAGIEIAYVPWARGATAGPGQAALQAAWCAPDQKAAYAAVIEQPGAVADAPAIEGCRVDPSIQRANAIAQKLGVRGTPALFTTDAQQLGGYRSAEELMQILGIAE